jgi:hypothetical protein
MNPPPARDASSRQAVDRTALADVPGSASVVDTFSLVVGGPFYAALRRLMLVGPAANIRGRLLVFFALTWVPLFVLAALSGTAVGNQVTVPLVRDYSMYGRLWVGLPLLIIAEIAIDPRLHRVAVTFDRSGIIGDADIATYRAALERVGSLRDSGLAELLLVLLASVPFFMLDGFEWNAPRITTWHSTTAGGLSAAGWWFAFVSSPLLRFLLLRWLWRGVLWGILLYHVTRLKLHLMPTHPDLLGGLGFVLAAQRQFGILFAAIGAILAGQYGNAIAYLGMEIGETKVAMAVYVCLAVLLVLCPLVLFVPQLAEVRRDGMSRYSQVARELTEAFDAKWARGQRHTGEAMLGDPDPSSLIDYVDSFNVVRNMRVLPINKELVLQVAAQAAAPLAVVWIVATPLDEIISGLVKMVA